ncbi:MAG: cAMP phosphodiesterase [Prochlorococcaceae cyanobacterium]
MPLVLNLSLRRCRPLLLGALIALLPFGLAVAPAAAAPASQAEMTLYSRIAALNVCISRAAGVEFDKAVAIAGETLAQLIQGQHDGAIQQVGAKPLSLEELRKGSINSAVIGAVEVCPKEVPADVLKKVQEVLKQGETKSPAQSAPASKGKAK